jgi:curli biogenesis system outer membrane secretion channel CsgG
LVLAVTLAGPGARASAQTVAPAVTVVSFDGARSRDDGDALADELANRLMETRRFRVLPRIWLPIPARASTADLNVLREAAAEANVEYLVLGSVSQARRTAPPPLPLIAAMSLLRMRPPIGVSPRAVETLLSVRVRVIEVATGCVVRTSVGSGRQHSVVLAPAAPVPGLIIAAGFGAMRRASAQPSGPGRPTAAGQHAVAEIARTLNLSQPARPAAELRRFR